jgi:CHAD domain-containing protein
MYVGSRRLLVREREVKLAVGDSFVLPNLESAVNGAGPGPCRERLVADCYFDTADLRLARWGCTLRHRDGEGWTVKIPVASSGVALSREEVTFPGDLGPPPAEAVQLLDSLTRGAAVEQQAQLCTRRTAYQWRDPAGTAILELVDDRVQADTASGDAVAFRQLEVELAPEAGEALLGGIVGELLEAGAELDRPVPKLVRVLGAPAAAPPDVVQPGLGAEPTAREVIHSAIARSVAHLLLHLPAARLGVDPEGVHQARVAIRRLRSDLRTFNTLVEPAWAGGLQGELRWLAGELGKVRDADVLLDRLEATVAARPEIDSGPAGRVIAALTAQRAADRASLISHLDDLRTRTLLNHLVSAANDPRTAPQADDPATERLGRVVRKRWRKLRLAVEQLGSDPEIEQLHEIRILAKRARYATQAVTAAYPDDAPAFAKALSGITDILGELNDTRVAQEWLLGAIDRLDPAAVFAAGRLAQVMHAEGTRRVPEWDQAYRAASRKRLRRWFR